MKIRHAFVETLPRQDHEFEIEKKPLQFRLILRLFGYTRPHARKRNWLFVMVVARSIQLPCVAWLLGAVIGGPIAHRDMGGLTLGVMGFAALVFSMDLMFHFRQRLALELGESVVHDLRNLIFEHLQRMPLSFFNKTRLGRIISRMTSDVESIRVGVQDVLFVAIIQGGQMLVSAGVMLYYDWALFSVVAGMAPILWVINRHFRVRLSKATREMLESFSRVTATLAESVGGIRVTQGFVRQDVNAGLFRNLVADHSRYNMGMARTSAVFIPLLEFNNQFFIAALLLVGGYRVLNPDHAMGVDNLVKFLFLANSFFHPILPLANQYNQALTAMAGAERVFKLLDTPPEWEDAPAATNLSGQLAGKVEFRHVTFGYDPAKPVLHDINFTAEPGQTVALVGHTGSGKTSIISLIAKFYLPTCGELFIDGQEIRRLRSESLHRQMGIVLQQDFLFSGTVMDNIRLGRPSATDAEVIDAARRLDSLDLIEAMPSGFMTMVGERGAGLSLGQRQLVCFTRALLANPRILILDEATSSVDTMTEMRLQKALATLLQGRTSFVVAHRLSTIRHASMVLVLDHGRIVEHGTHVQLLAKRGVYARLYRQFIKAVESG